LQERGCWRLIDAAQLTHRIIKLSAPRNKVTTRRISNVESKESSKGVKKMMKNSNGMSLIWNMKQRIALFI
jgi:hypothetical protein